MFFLYCGEGCVLLAEKDITEKSFIRLNDVFADVFNGLIFKGEQIVTPDSLKTMDVNSQNRADDVLTGNHIGILMNHLHVALNSRPQNVVLNQFRAFHQNMNSNHFSDLGVLLSSLNFFYCHFPIIFS